MAAITNLMCHDGKQLARHKKSLSIARMKRELLKLEMKIIL